MVTGVAWKAIGAVSSGFWFDSNSLRQMSKELKMAKGERRIRVTFTDTNNEANGYEMPIASSIHVVIPAGFSDSQSIVFFSHHVCQELLTYAAEECIQLSKKEQ